jgi:hypothetical protein
VAALCGWLRVRERTKNRETGVAMLEWNEEKQGVYLRAGALEVVIQERGVDFPTDPMGRTVIVVADQKMLNVRGVGTLLENDLFMV